MNDDEIKTLKKKAALWKKLALARGRMLAAYRLQVPPGLSAIDAAGAARTALQLLGETKA